jgi:oligoendopeptidase F
MNAHNETLAADVTWRLADITGSNEGASINALLDDAEARAGALQPMRGRLASLTAGELGAFWQGVEDASEPLARAGNFAQLRFATDTADPANGALMMGMQERATAIATTLVWVELEWAALDDAFVDVVLADPALRRFRHHLRVVRLARPHLLTEPEEKILAEKSLTGGSAWSRLFDELLSVLRVQLPSAGEVALEEAFSRTQSVDRNVRAEAAAGITEALLPGLRTRAYIYNTLLADKATDDRLRAYDSWIAARNLSNQASDESISALIEAVVSRYDLVQRWYRLKAKLLGLDRLSFYDRNAALPTGEETAVIDWEEARDTVIDAYASYSPVLADGARRFFDEQWIDAPLRPAKQGGAFCAPITPSSHPYVLVNFTGTRRDVLTLAHELGHGLHFLLARGQSLFEHVTPLTLAETASVFGEAVTFGRLLENETDPRRRLALLASSVDDAIATVFRQVSMWRFEDLAHRARRSEGELSVERINALWLESQHELFGDTIDTQGYESWWSYIPHFIHTPGYVYAYAYGQLLAMSVYQRSLDGGPAFADKYLAMLAAGGSRSPEELTAMVNCDLNDPEFWSAGLDLVEQRLAEAEAAADALS